MNKEGEGKDEFPPPPPGIEGEEEMNSQPLKHTLLLPLHPPQELIEIVLLLILALIPQLPQPIQPPLLSLLLHLAHRIHRVLLSPILVRTGALLRKQVGAHALIDGVDVEEVEDLVCFHAVEACVLLVDDCGGDVNFKALKAVVGRVRLALYLLTKRRCERRSARKTEDDISGRKETELTSEFFPPASPL